jgi:hypothetical protein
MSTFASCTSTIGTSLFDVGAPKVISVLLTMLPLASVVRWQGKNGIKVVKNYHFKKGSYVVGVDYKISNNSNQTIPVKSYVRLIRNAIDQSNYKPYY